MKEGKTKKEGKRKNNGTDKGRTEVSNEGSERAGKSEHRNGKEGRKVS